MDGWTKYLHIAKRSKNVHPLKLPSYPQVCETLYGAIAQDIFILSTETSETSTVPQALCRPVASAATDIGRLVLSRWRSTADHSASAAVSVDSARDFVMLRSTRQSLRPDHKLVVLTRFPAPEGLKGELNL